ncbi:hypothetical protein B0H16DRAFT_1762316 [Mycena metata]|uniref:Uncharacterized protein n=1 Tax=Mycena metata TaxID=1033252 RepID=A0AAD7I8Z9_9AGAR|nr:hypothetical protein B0H16DRAFT_1762316 [Mycena metata]
MFVQPKNRAPGPTTNHNVPAPRGFAVRVFKGPTLSSFPYTATAKFDVGYRPSVNSDPRQAQNWHPHQPTPISREPPKSRFGSWTENRGRDTPRPSVAPSYADFIYERSLSSKSDIYSDNDASSIATSTPSSVFSPALSADSTVTSAPSEVPLRSPTASTSTATPSSPRHPFPLHIPALTQAQSAIRGLFVHPNGDVSQSNPSPLAVPAAPAARTSNLPDMGGSPPRFLPPAGPSSPNRTAESPSSFAPLNEYFPPPPSESEVGEAQRLALLNAQHNSASSAYYQAGLRVVENGRRDGEVYGAHRSIEAPDSRRREQSPERAAWMATTARSVASSSIPGGSSDSQGHVVYESSSLADNPPMSVVGMTADRVPTRVSPTTSPPRVAYVPSNASSSTAVESDHRWRDSYAQNARNVPVSQLVELDGPHLGDRTRVLSDPGRYEELRGLNMLSDRQRDTYVNAFAPGTQPRALQLPEIPAVVRSDDSHGGGRVSPIQERSRRVSGNLWSSLPQLPDRRSPVQAPSRPSSTPPLPRIDTSRASDRRMAENNMNTPVHTQPQPPPQREAIVAQPPPPHTAPPINSTRSRTPLAGPRVLPAEPQRRRSDGDQPMSTSPGLLKRTSAIFHRSSSPEHSAPREVPVTRPPRPGALPLDPQRRRSDGFQSVVPPRPPMPPVQAQAAPAPRNVRWNENLVCPSPIFASQRRKGWFNRRGDQLWTNDGAYKPAPADHEFPPDLRDYPAYGSGWMNEDGVRIDMGHRLIPKAPLRSALKQRQARGPVIEVEHRN